MKMYCFSTPMWAKLATVVGLLMLIASAGLARGRSHSIAAADAMAAEQLAAENRLLAGMQPADGTVQISTEGNRICVEARLGRSGGSACMSASASEPMVFVGGGSSAEAAAQIVVVDPQRRLESLQMLVNGQPLAATSSDGGFSIHAVVPAAPADFTVLGTDGATLASGNPAARVERAAEQARNAEGH